MAQVINLNAYFATAPQPGLFSRLRAAIASRRKFALIHDELDRLSERELADLGMSRLNLRDVAREAAYGR